jgi:hypothetical protein
LHSLTGLFISFASSSLASCFFILLKCNGCYGSYVISSVLYPLINLFPESIPFVKQWQKLARSIQPYRFAPLFMPETSGKTRRGEERTVVYILCCKSRPAQAVTIASQCHSQISILYRTNL